MKNYTHIPLILDRKVFATYSVRMKHLRPNANKPCIHGAAGALCVQPLQGHTGTRMHYHSIVMLLAEYSSTVCLSYDVGNVYFDLAQTQQHVQSIVQLAHACPTMSCIHLVLCHVLNSVLSYIISGLNLLWSDRNYTSLE